MKTGFVIDFSELEKFTKQMSEMSDDFNNFLEEFLIEMAMREIAEIKLKQSGHMGEQFKAVDTGAMINAWKISDIQGRGKDMDILIENDMEYSSHVEFGHDGKYVPALGVTLWAGENKYWTPGKFMMTTSIQNIQAQMPKRYEEKFKEFCKKHKLKAD